MPQNNYVERSIREHGRQLDFQEKEAGDGLGLKSSRD
jgi:hypothetical protein